jgi:leucine dehydrogenase
MTAGDLTLVTADAGLALGETEELVVVHDRASGLGAAVAIDDSTLGPAIGGVRWRTYPDEAAAITEVRRLARVMTLKSALAGIPSGGAKAVVFRPAPGVDERTRRTLMETFGRIVRRLDGRYVPGLDMGTSLDDLETMSTQAPGICVLEPSHATAVALFAGIESAAGLHWPHGLKGKRALVQGAGHVGSTLAGMLAAAGAAVAVADVDGERAARVAQSVAGSVVDPGAVIGYPCEVFAPCAVGRLVDAETAGAFRCELLAGAANDVLAHRDGAEALRTRGIDYVPDFAINSGGVIAIHAAGAGWDGDRTAAALAAVGVRVREILEQAHGAGVAPLQIAEELASLALGHRVSVPE